MRNTGLWGFGVHGTPVERAGVTGLEGGTLGAAAVAGGLAVTEVC